MLIIRILIIIINHNNNGNNKKSHKLLLVFIEVRYLCKHSYSCSLAGTTATSINMSSTAVLVMTGSVINTYE